MLDEYKPHPKNETEKAFEAFMLSSLGRLPRMSDIDREVFFFAGHKVQEDKIKELEAKVIECAGIDASWAAIQLVINPRIEELEKKLAEAVVDCQNEFYEKVAINSKLTIAVNALGFYKDNNNIRATKDECLNVVALQALLKIKNGKEGI